MKTCLMKRLAAFIAASAVIFGASLSAMSQAQAAVTYTLDQLGGTASVTSFKYRDEQVKGHYGSSADTVGTYTVPENFNGGEQYSLGVHVEFPLSQVNSGDKVSVPLLAPPRGHVVYHVGYTCGTEDVKINDVVIGRKSCSGDSYDGFKLNVTFNDAVADYQLYDFKLDTSVGAAFSNGAALITNPDDLTYTEAKGNLFVGIGSSRFFYEKEPWTGTLGGGKPPSWSTSTYTKMLFSRKSTSLEMVGRYRLPGLMNYVLKGDYTSTSSQVTSNFYAVHRFDTLSGATVSNLRVLTQYPVMATSCDYFSADVSGADSRTSMYTQVTVDPDALRDDFNAVETLLAPGQYAIIQNSDGTIDVAINYGPLYNNSLNAFPDTYTYNYTDSSYENPTACIAQGNANVNTLRDGGFGNPNGDMYVELTLNDSEYAQSLKWTQWTKVAGRTATTSGDAYWRSDSTSSGGDLTRSFVTYRANSDDVTGTGPDNTVGDIGSDVQLAGNGTWARTGYSFAGWNTKADGSGTSYKPGQSVSLTDAGLVLYAQWAAIDDVVSGDQPKPAGYVTVVFDEGDNGVFVDDNDDLIEEEIKFYVNPNKTVTLTAPSVEADTRWKHNGWDKLFENVQFADDTTITALYERVYAVWVNVGFPRQANDFVLLGRYSFGESVTVLEDQLQVPVGYELVNVTASIAESGDSETVTSFPWTFTMPAKDVYLVLHKKKLDSVIPGDQPKPDGYVTVTFAGGDHGALSGETSYHVNPDEIVTLSAPTVTAETGWSHSGWDGDFENIQFKKDTVITAQYTSIADVVDGDQPKPAGYVKVTFNKGASGSLSGETSFWVNPSKTVTLTAPTVKPNTGYVFDKWDKVFANTEFTADTTITALYKAEELVEIYRMYDGIEHLYVNTTTERDALVARGWKYEGVAFYTPKTSSTAVHRLFQKATGDHHYTSDPTEIATLTGKHGWTDEGVLFYGDDAKRVELKRLFMAGLGKGEHLHTADPNELEALTSKHGWKPEGISFYVAKFGE